MRKSKPSEEENITKDQLFACAKAIGEQCAVFLFQDIPNNLEERLKSINHHLARGGNITLASLMELKSDCFAHKKLVNGLCLTQAVSFCYQIARDAKIPLTSETNISIQDELNRTIKKSLYESPIQPIKSDLKVDIDELRAMSEKSGIRPEEFNTEFKEIIFIKYVKMQLECLDVIKEAAEKTLGNSSIVQGAHQQLKDQAKSDAHKYMTEKLGWDSGKAVKITDALEQDLREERAALTQAKNQKPHAAPTVLQKAPPMAGSSDYLIDTSGGRYWGGGGGQA